MRGFGAVQACFAHEAQMDKLASALEIDPIELRLLNALAPGGVIPTGQRITGSLPVAEVIRRAAALPIPEPEPIPSDPIRLPGGSGNTTRGEGVKRGVGFAVGFRSSCFAEGFDDYTAARVKLHSDGSAEIDCAAVDVGQGVSDVILQVARTEAERTTSSSRRARPPPSTRPDLPPRHDSRTWCPAPSATPAAPRSTSSDEPARRDVDVERVYRHPERHHSIPRPAKRPGSVPRSRTCAQRCASSQKWTSNWG